MYYIVNETKQIIAADQTFLTLCDVSDITALNTNIILKNILFDTKKENQLSIQLSNKRLQLSIETIPLSSLIGTLSLIMVKEPIAKAKKEIETITQSDMADLLLPKADTSDIHIIKDIEKEIATEAIVDMPTISDKTDSIQETIFIDATQISQNIGVSEEDFHAFLDEYISTALSLEKELQSKDTGTRKDALHTLSHLGDVLHLDVIHHDISQIEVATSENRTEAVSQFFDTLSRITTVQNTASVVDEKKALSTFDISKPEEKTEPIKVVDTPTTKAENITLDLDIDLPAISPKKEPSKETFNADIFELDLDTPLQQEKPKTVDTPLKEDKFELDVDVPESKSATEKTDTNKPKEKKETQIVSKEMKSFGEIDLSPVQPISFDFSLHTAAEELSLPDSLIEEFMTDFIAQAHTETDNMLEAYKKGDLETVQKIGHLLKGVSSNLRITPLADTLYKIQFCKDSNDLERLIKDYWGHFLSFENQMNKFSN